MISDEAAQDLANRWRPTRTLPEQEWAALAVWVRASLLATWDPDSLDPRGRCLHRLMLSLGWDGDRFCDPGGFWSVVRLVQAAGWPPEVEGN